MQSSESDADGSRDGSGGRERSVAAAAIVSPPPYIRAALGGPLLLLEDIRAAGDIMCDALGIYGQCRTSVELRNGEGGEWNVAVVALGEKIGRSFPCFPLFHIFELLQGKCL